jgi:hypothetical protein
MRGVYTTEIRIGQTMPYRRGIEHVHVFAKVGYLSWPGFVPAIRVFLASALQRRGCAGQALA